MSAHVEQMFSVMQTPWHGIGHVLDAAPTSLEAIQLAGLDWDVELAELATSDGQGVDNWRAVRRATDRSIYGVVSSRYQPLQNREAFGFFDPIIAGGEATYETAGSLHGGKVVWILAKLNRDPMVIQGDDAVEKFVLLSNGHGGSMACRVGFVPIRVVCHNTLSIAHHDDRSELVRVRHTSGIVANLEKLRAVLDLADAQFEATAEQYRALARRQINKADLAAYVRRVFDLAPSGAPEGEAPSPEEKRSRVLDAVTRLFETGRGSDLPGAAGTLWGAYNAVTEYLGYERGASQDNRLHSMWYGAGVETNERALEYAYNYVLDAA